MQKMIGKVDYFTTHRRENICCDAYVKGVFQLEFACKKGVLLALWYALFVSIVMRRLAFSYSL